MLNIFSDCQKTDIVDRLKDFNIINDINLMPETFLYTDGLKLGLWSKEAMQRSQNPYYPDFDQKWNYHKKTFARQSIKNDPLYRALGLHKNKYSTIIDATCGLGGDSLLFAYFGLSILSFEQSELLYTLIDFEIERFKERTKLTWQHRQGDFLDSNQAAQIVYLDPMYSASASKKTLPSKEMQLLRAMDLPETEPIELLEMAKTRASNRVVVKRPVKAPQIAKPDFNLTGKSTRYDVYLTH